MTTAPAPTTNPGPWEFTHRIHYLNQIETRAGAPTADGTQWAENRLTGLVNVVCNCGYSSGWVPRDGMPLPADMIGAHPHPGYAPPTPATAPTVRR